MEFIKLIATALLSVGTLFLTTKILGHKQISELDFFDYVSGITVGSIGAELATDLEAPWKSFIALFIWCGASVFLNFLTRTLPKTRKFINGTPTVIIDGGVIYKENMKKARLDLSELMLLCREAGYFNLSDIGTAIFEYNGKLSILPLADKAPLTPSDLNIPVRPKTIGVELIMDGRVMGENLVRSNISEKRLEELLSANGYKSARDVLLAVGKEDGSVTFFPMKAP